MTMIKQRSPAASYVQPYRYSSPNIPLSAIRRFARQIAERFHPDKIILFGSYAYGRPHNESDVDLLVIMPAYDVVNQSIRICNAFDVWPFSLDLIVRTPKQIERGLREDACATQAESTISHALCRGFPLPRRACHDAADASGTAPGRACANRTARPARPATVIADGSQDEPCLAGHSGRPFYALRRRSAYPLSIYG